MSYFNLFQKSWVILWRIELDPMVTNGYSVYQVDILIFVIFYDNILELFFLTASLVDQCKNPICTTYVLTVLYL